MLHSIFAGTAWIGLVILVVAVVGGYFWVMSNTGHYGGITEFYISACAAALGLSVLIVGIFGWFFT